MIDPLVGRLRRPRIYRSTVDRPDASIALRASASSSGPGKPLTPIAPTRRPPSKTATPPWKNVKKGSKLARSAGVLACLLGKLGRRPSVAPSGGIGLALRVETRVGSRAVHRRRSDELSMVVCNEDRDGAGGILDDEADLGERLLEPHRPILTQGASLARRNAVSETD